MAVVLSELRLACLGLCFLFKCGTLGSRVKGSGFWVQGVSYPARGAVQEVLVEAGFGDMP